MSTSQQDSETSNNLADFRESSASFDRVNAMVAVLVGLISAAVYWNTVQPTVSFWDCGEFIASSYILGIPHPPGSPLFIILGRLFSVLPFIADVALRVNLISVLSSAATAIFGYLVVVRMIKFWYQPKDRNSLTRYIGYIGGFTGALFLAFSSTNWGNAVEAEVYGLSMMLTLAVLWLALRFHENRATTRGFRFMALAIYLAMLGVGIHLTVFLVVPVAAIFFVIKKDAPQISWVYLCSFFVIELVLLTIISFAGIKGGYFIFLFLSAIMFFFLAYKLYNSINLSWVIVLAATSMIMLGFWKFIIGLGVAAIALIFYGMKNTKATWRPALVVLLLAFLGFSVNLFIPIRSSVNPRIDENNPSKDFTTFVNFLERKQYGSTSMTERMFNRRGYFENQFGRSPHMGFWSYFEEQYSPGRYAFVPFFLLGMFGIYMMIRKKVEIGYPFFILLLLGSAGLVLYMNFADGMRYNPATNDAYMEVRNRDYFFTPAFILFGMAIGMGISGIMELVRQNIAGQSRKMAVYATSALAGLAYVPFNHNYFTNDRSKNYIPYDYAANILASMPKDGVLFTSGDNDTFPLWCLQEAYLYRLDVRTANLSLLNTDWYVEQMKNRYGVPMDLTDSQIVWNTYEYNGKTISRPAKMFKDRARGGQMRFLVAQGYNGRALKVQDMMVDEITLSSKFEIPVGFTSEPYAESPLKLRERKEMVGVVKLLTLNPPQRFINADKSYDLYMNTYKFRGLDDPGIFKDDNATGVLVSVGFGAVQVFNEYLTMRSISNQIQVKESEKDVAGGNWTDEQQAQLDSMIASMNGYDPADSLVFKQKAETLLDSMMVRYPEFWMAYIVMSEHFTRDGDSAKALEYLYTGEKNIQMFLDQSPANANYLQDLGLVKFEIAKLLGAEDGEERMEKSLELTWAGFDINRNSGMAYQKLVQYLFERRRNSDIIKATQLHAAYGVNYYNNKNVQAILQQAGVPPPPRPR